MRLRKFIVFVLYLLVPSFAHLHGQISDDKDLAEVRAYVLTMENAKHIYVTMSQIKQASEKDPNLQKTMTADSDDDKGNQSLSAVTAKMSAVPAIVSIIANNGFTPRQLVVAEFALIQSGFAAAAVKMGAPREKLIAEGAVSAANLDFVQQHHEELEELGKKYPIQ